MSQPRIVFLHGLEGSPRGTKARFLAEHFDTLIPALTTAQADKTPGVPQVVLDEAAAAIAAHAPDVVAGSSFGGAVLLELLHRGEWSGPTLFLASAGPARTGHRSLPPGYPAAQCLLIHGRGDKVVPFSDSETFAIQSGATLWAIDDVHRLPTIVRGKPPRLHSAVDHLLNLAANQ